MQFLGKVFNGQWQLISVYFNSYQGSSYPYSNLSPVAGSCVHVSGASWVYLVEVRVGKMDPVLPMSGICTLIAATSDHKCTKRYAAIVVSPPPLLQPPHFRAKMTSRGFKGLTLFLPSFFYFSFFSTFWSQTLKTRLFKRNYIYGETLKVTMHAWEKGAASENT